MDVMTTQSIVRQSISQSVSSLVIYSTSCSSLHSVSQSANHSTSPSHGPTNKCCQMLLQIKCCPNRSSGNYGITSVTVNAGSVWQLKGVMLIRCGQVPPHCVGKQTGVTGKSVGDRFCGAVWGNMSFFNLSRVLYASFL